MRSEQEQDQATGLPVRDLSDWQLDRVRDALRAYHSYGRDSDGARYTWKDVREAITEYTGFEIGKSAKIGAERLRQFVFGIKDKDNPEIRTFPKPHPDNLQAIVAFVTHEELDLLRPEELEDYTPGPQALKRLHEYFYEGCDLKSSFPAFKCGGSFAAIQKENDNCTVARLTMQDHGDDLLEVTETRELYDARTETEAEELSKENSSARLSYKQYGGWAILTPEDRLILFMKDPCNGRNHSYYCLNDIGMFPQAMGTRLLLLRSEFPYETTMTQLGYLSVHNDLDNDTYVFNRETLALPKEVGTSPEGKPILPLGNRGVFH